MQSTELLLKGVELMLFGMGFVFVFLSLLILSVRLMSAVVARCAPPAPPAAVSPAAPATGLPDADTLAAISIAVARHRARRP